MCGKFGRMRRWHKCEKDGKGIRGYGGIDHSNHSGHTESPCPLPSAAAFNFIRDYQVIAGQSLYTSAHTPWGGNPKFHPLLPLDEYAVPTVGVESVASSRIQYV